MNLEQAKQIIESAINAGFLKGVYSIQDASQIIQALQIIYKLEASEQKSTF